MIISIQGNMISLNIIIPLLCFHWLSDFVFQTDYWARNKSKSNAILGLHVLVYSLLMGLTVFTLTFRFYESLVFIIITYICHFITDYGTSRITSKLAIKEKWHDFFVVIGFDQFLHMTQILLTFYLLMK